MRSQRKSDSDLAVSEVIGVVMLLAMVITMMGGVFVFLTPYVNDFQDNTAWSNANGIAERLDGRIDVVAGASADTGLRTTIPLTMSSISPIISAEVWTVSADLTAGEIVTVQYINQTTFSLISENETADRAVIWTEGGEAEISFNETYEEVLITHNLSVADIYIVTVFDGENEIHKHAKIPISGLMVKTKVQTGEHSIGLLTMLVTTNSLMKHGV